MALVITETKCSDFKTLISRFKIPMELLDDIIYCQRSLRQYMRAHQILVGRLPDKSKGKQLEEIEREICDIGREQNTLIARLRSMLELYYMSIKNENIEIDREIGNAYVSRIISHHIENGNAAIIPKIVKKRLNEMQLLACYGLHDIKRKPDNSYKFDCKVTAANPTNLKQESLLKPKSERFALQKANTYPYGKADNKTENDGGLSAASPSINNSRLNLLQALNKARNQSLNLTKPPRSPPALVVDTKETIEISSSQSSTTSDDSDVPLVSPAFSEDETEVSQEMFLRKFGLFTVEYSRYLQQKRSQRRRRNVQSNEKSDFHYGKLDMFEKMNKKKKTYLHSPPATRAVKKRRIGKDGDGTTSKSSSTDRSTSSSPDQKLVCCECNKSENLSKCDTCLNFYHKQCHKMAPKLVAKKICPECFLKFNHVKETKSSREVRTSRESRESKTDKDAKDGNSRGSKYPKDDVDLGIAPLDNDN